MKVVISAGGVGSRLSSVTECLIPKSLCKPFIKPVIFYQLEALHEFGCSSVYLSFNSHWQINRFKELIKTNDVPNLDYTFGIHRYGHPMNAFEDSSLQSYVSNSKVLWSWGDCIFDKRLLADIVFANKYLGNSVACSSGANDSFVPLPGKEYIMYEPDALGVVRHSRYSSTCGIGTRDSVGLFAPVLIDGQSTKLLLDVIKLNNMRSLSFLLDLISNKHGLSVIEPDLLVNVNCPEDLVQLALIEKN